MKNEIAYSEHAPNAPIIRTIRELISVLNNLPKDELDLPLVSWDERGLECEVESLCAGPCGKGKSKRMCIAFNLNEPNGL